MSRLFGWRCPGWAAHVLARALLRRKNICLCYVMLVDVALVDVAFVSEYRHLEKLQYAYAHVVDFIDCWTVSSSLHHATWSTDYTSDCSVLCTNLDTYALHA